MKKIISGIAIAILATGAVVYANNSKTVAVKSKQPCTMCKDCKCTDCTCSTGSCGDCCSGSTCCSSSTCESK